jgi:general secretion pathway protein E
MKTADSTIPFSPSVFRSDFLGDAKLVSSAGDLAASEEERKFLCLLADGRLLIAEGHRLNAHVLSYQARLERMHIPFHIEAVNIEVIRRRYVDSTTDAGDRGHSMMQVTAKEWLTKACNARASDIHIRVRKTRTEIYFRVHNDLVPAGEQTREHGERLLATLYGAMTSISDNSYKPTERQDACIADRDKLPPKLFGVRIATAPTSDGMVMVMRLLYNDAGDNIDLRPLGFSDVHATLLQRMKEQPLGMNILSGPTGSGKSTTLQRALQGQIIEAGGKMHVLTVEDPVEYPIEGAVQTAVTNAPTEDERSRLFAASISNAMRLDPDTIMIGEMRDRASAQNALRAAMTGHQVWTTVHANSAVAIIDRLVDLGLPLSMVADHTILTGLISQRLVKLLCAHCKEPLVQHQDALPAGVMSRVRAALGGNISNACVVGKGCGHCNHAGTVGRTVVAEVIIPDDEFFRYIRMGEKTKAVAYWIEHMNGKTILEHAIEKVTAGLIDPRMAEQVMGHLASTVPAAGARLNLVEAAGGT